MQLSTLLDTPCCSYSLNEFEPEDDLVTSDNDDEDIDHLNFSHSPEIFLSQKRSHKHVVKYGADSYFNKNFVSDRRMVAALKRCKTTPADASLILSTAITVGGGNPQSVNLSYSHVHKTLTKQCDKISQTIKQQ